MLKAVIVDDELLAIQRLQKIVEETNAVKVVKTFENGDGLLEEIIKSNIDLVFLDINLPESSGIELASEIIENNERCRIVFVTAYDQYALKAFELGALDYILKPYSSERVHALIQRHMTSTQLTSVKFTIHAFNYFHIKKDGVELKNIRWRTTKARELFSFLVQHSEGVIRKDVLVELFWPDLDMKSAYDNLYTTIYQLRKTIEELGIGVRIVNSNHGYEIEFNSVEYDVIEWAEGIDEIETLMNRKSQGYLAKVIKVYTRVKELYKGHFLSEESSVWKENLKEQYMIMFFSISREVIQLLMREELYTEAILNSLHIQKLYPHLDYPYFVLMQLYSKLDDRQNVEKHYEKLKEMLEKEYGTSPNNAIRNWYQQWISLQFSS
ncbi:response regulator [Jeotgalibacillus haloalkalitolerans]|uniref:Response regulator n=1 Tax=Jeotgalibacillus haloalkalitolerans TaxID=3104292 RepID=A0ABU5KJD1_9BACL|nr:response regulator [Jeotgalibacillus sp. HH7-29]MDZ5711364.1 response regulator [Jeotgalibacillus sp. HH7-29]